MCASFSIAIFEKPSNVLTEWNVNVKSLMCDDCVPVCPFETIGERVYCGRKVG